MPLVVVAGAYSGEGALAEGIRVCVSSYTRHHVNVMMTKAKVVGNYANSQLAKMEAINSGYDEAVMLDVQGNGRRVRENIFIVRRGTKMPRSRLFWKALRGIRSSIWRGTWGCRSKSIFSRDELYIADELFTGTAAELTPIREVDNRTTGGRPGPITHKLQQAFFRVARER